MHCTSVRVCAAVAQTHRSHGDTYNRRIVIGLMGVPIRGGSAYTPVERPLIVSTRPLFCLIQNRGESSLYINQAPRPKVRDEAG